MLWTRALVTGASSGIGECIARSLAADHVSLVLVARRRERLESIAAELRRDQGCEVEVIAADLTEARDLLMVENRLASAEQPVDLLVNNAGGMRLSVFPAHGGEDETYWIRLNVTAVVRLTGAVLPRMRESGRGAILNMSSGAAFHPHPFAAVYGASRAFVNSFSEAIREENRAHGISVTVVCPGFTNTDLAEHSGFDVSRVPAVFWMSAEKVAAHALAAAANGQRVCVPGLLNKLDAAYARYAPRRLVIWSVAKSTLRLWKKD